MTESKSNFHHPGETKLQEQAGSRERTAQFSQALIRHHLIEQHQEFYAGLEYVFVSAVDSSRNLRAVMVSGERGFLSTPHDKVLRLDAANSDVLDQLGNLEPAALVGVVGVDMSNRRRNRMHGRISAVHDSHIDIRVTQSYGNCPKYINMRELTAHFERSDMLATETRAGLIEKDRAIIRASDTFFIASYFDAGKGQQFEGADMSSRGGLPGFVHVEGDSLTVPDYSGNNLFNTFGNILLNPVVALLFIDFETGDTLHLTGTAEVVNNEVEVARHPKALRLMRVTVRSVTAKQNATSLRWDFREASSYNPSAALRIVE